MYYNARRSSLRTGTCAIYRRYYQKVCCVWR